MAESIVRHEIANLSINEVISERKKVRDGITRAMQEILSGWGIWLETVEITDVKILSGTLFNNLQQPFRSATRQVCHVRNAKYKMTSFHSTILYSLNMTTCHLSTCLHSSCSL